MFLSKSDYQVGRRCLKRLWNEKHGKWSANLSANDKKNAFEGNRFNDSVRDHFPNGVMIGWGHGTVEQAAVKTAEYLKSAYVTLFEAFFLHNGLLCLADVVVKQDGKITLIEVKSSNNPKITKKDDFEHIHDAAFQTYVMAQHGYKPDEVLLLHENGDCIWPDKENLFSFVNITEESFDLFYEVEITSTRLLAEINKANSPKQSIGKFCKKPADKACPNIETCWSLPIEQTIYDLPRLSGEKLEALQMNDIHLIKDIPTNANLADAQWDIVNLIQNEAELVDKEKVQELLAQLKYPLHFFDFETYNPAVPMWPSSKPWQQIPFQYSLHILYQDGKLDNYDYLHTDTTDPRPGLLATMQEHFLESGSVVVYYAPFEKSRIKEMANNFPEYKNFLSSLNDRVWDQLDVFKHCFYDHRLALSKSIKVVLPTFVPELSYKTLNVQKGDQAQLEWRKMIDLKWEPTKKKLANDLKAYCELDTFAMVKLHHFLEGLIKD